MMSMNYVMRKVEKMINDEVAHNAAVLLDSLEPETLAKMAADIAAVPDADVWFSDIMAAGKRNCGDEFMPMVGAAIDDIEAVMV